MTKETKIGLLVGLAFIILFAIILSEKGSNPRDVKAPVFSPLDGAGPSIASAGTQRPLQDAGRLPLDSQLAAHLVAPPPAAPEEQVSQATADNDGLAAPLPSSLAELIGPQSAQAEVASTPVSPSWFVDGSRSIADRVGPEYVSSGDASAPTIREPVLAQARESSPARLPSASMTGVPPQHESARVKAEHVVQSGESLSKIAAKYYGRYTRARVDAIIENNRDAIKSAASVRPGTRLRIPDLGEGFEPAPTFAVAEMREPIRSTGQLRIPLPIGEESMAATPTPIRNDPPTVKTAALRDESPRLVRTRVYEVRKKDTLSGIARRELGSEKLLRELVRLNQDVLAEKKFIKPGMKLRLPILASSMATPAGVLSASAGAANDSEP